MIALPPAWGKHGSMTGMPLTGRSSPGSGLPAFATVAERAHDDGGRGGVRTALWPRLELSLEPDFEAASRAREALEELDGHVEDDVLDDMRLLVTELVTNSVRHADARPDEPVRLEVTVDHGRVLVAVEDGGNGFRPRRRTPNSPDEGGWGLHLVEQVSDRWGVEGDARTRVWLELDRSDRRSGETGRDDG
jgi:anti-sigma regulatory factor (Ser/Thr protein kinase)